MPSIEQWMRAATRLTQNRQIRQATAAIRTAMAQGGKAAWAQHAAGLAAAAAKPQGDVIDIDARTVGTEADGAAATTRRTGPDEAPAEGRFSAGSYTASAGTLAYKLYVPPGNAGRNAPLVVMLHGCKQDPDDFAAGTGMNALARAQGFNVLYPAQAQGANPSRCWNWFKHNHQQRGRGEPQLLAGMTRQVLQQTGADPRRVYVAGLSAGGAMAAILGQTDPDLFAAVGVHSGLASGSASDLPSALAAMRGGSTATAAMAARGAACPPTIVFHGDQDTTVHPLNGEQVLAAGAPPARLHVERGRQGPGRAYTRRTYAAPDGTVLAEHWEVHGAGHAWSGGQPAGSYTDASAAMLRFFFSHWLSSAH